jgi:hypothetical protein
MATNPVSLARILAHYQRQHKLSDEAMASHLDLAPQAFLAYRSGADIPHHRRLRRWARVGIGRYTYEDLRARWQNDHRQLKIKQAQPRSSWMAEKTPPDLLPIRVHELLSRYAVQCMTAVEPQWGTKRVSLRVCTKRILALGSLGARVTCFPWHRCQRRLPNLVQDIGIPVLGATVQGPMQRSPQTYPQGTRSVLIGMVLEALSSGYAVLPLKLPRATFMLVLYGTAIVPSSTVVDLKDNHGDVFRFQGRAYPDLRRRMLAFAGLPA